ncbi:MAG: DUF4426 domain-containing protein [endosymbiont of Galathealinum brachiosum]|uniref:DUF4426 domain-containing protein n=1 Tax=endosymbiont of Galathealinum brachiosum TaxID=2200906 RepID=A0A370D986_9GAMM|nr:MAG: DUF4426 domain-containing protein [endosymbiont of Galathealinum brachiosum]
MTQHKITLISVLMLFFSLFSGNINAENSKQFGNYVIHYNAFRSDTLTPEIAKAYSLTRRNNRMVINITVQKKNGDVTRPVKAKVNGFASNLTGQIKALEFKEIHDGEAIYYLAQSQVSNQETLKFDIKATPAGESLVANVKFKQKFYTD